MLPPRAEKCRADPMQLQAEVIAHSAYKSGVAVIPGEVLDGIRQSPAADFSAAPLRILLIVESSACGTGRHVLDLADGLIQRGHTVYLVHSTIRCDQLFEKRLAGIKGIKCLALPMHTPPHPSDYGIVRAIRKLEPGHGSFDIVHGHSSKGGALARLAALGTGAKTFYTPHGLISLDTHLRWWKQAFYVSVERILSWFTDGIIAVAPEEGRAAAAIGLNPRKLTTIPNGLEPLELAPRAAARHAIGVSDKEVVIGFVGRLVEQKAPDVLLKSFALASRSAPNARLAIVGDGRLSSSLKAISRDMRVQDKIIWLGERDAREILAGFDLFALASRKEGLPYVVLEAMAAGLPLVATASAGIEILVAPEVNGLVVPTDDVDAFAAALTRLLENPELMARFAAASRSAVARFSIDAMIDNTLGYYRSKLSARSPH
jgi:glycosyltransferase involved in cell wall biosynthesis